MPNTTRRPSGEIMGGAGFCPRSASDVFAGSTMDNCVIAGAVTGAAPRL